ncbi:MAG: hypothetical protein DDT20_01839 [Firmicutes bacterium]|nr:hypothetical protein [Bacillota bacterium]
MRDPKRNPEKAERAFMFRLARDLSMTVAELERRMTTAEFTEWLAFCSAEAKEEAAAYKRAEQKGKRGSKRGRR